MITQTESTTLLRRTHRRCGLFLPSRTDLHIWLHSRASVACIIDTIGSRLPEEVSSWMQQLSSWYGSMSDLLTQRDLPEWGLPAKPQTTQRLLKMLAAVHGSAWNASQLGQSLGLDYKTVNSYVDYLAGAFLIRRLPSYQANIRKRLIKSPKVYWRDSGLMHALMNVAD